MSLKAQSAGALCDELARHPWCARVGGEFDRGGGHGYRLRGAYPIRPRRTRRPAFGRCSSRPGGDRPGPGRAGRRVSARRARMWPVADVLPLPDGGITEDLAAGLWSIAADLTEGFVAADASGVLIFANQALESVLGWRAVDVVGRPLTCLIPS